MAEVYRHYCDALARAAESGLFDIIGHPGNTGYFGFRPAEGLVAELEGAFVERVAPLADRVCLEVNSGCYLRPGRELFPRPAAE